MNQNNLANNPFAMLFNSTEDAKLFKSHSGAALSEMTTDESKPNKELAIKAQVEIDSFLENVFLITTNNVTGRDRPAQCVFLEDFKSLNSGQDWLDVSMIEQAVFERLTMDNPAASVLTTSSSAVSAGSQSVAAEPDAVKYLYQCYKRCVELRRRPQSISQECVDRCTEVIIQNGRIAFQLMNAVFPTTRPCYQFVEIMFESLVEGDTEVAGKFFELISAQIVANPEEGLLMQALKPALDDVKSRLRLDYVLEDPMLYRIIEFAMFFTRSPALAEVLVSHSTPADLANSKAYENTLLGRLLSASCVPPTDIGPFLYFNEPSRLTKPEVDLAEQRIQQMLARLTDALHQLMLRLLKLGGDSRHLILEWIANCLHANKGRAKLWNNQMMPMQLTSMFCSDGFFLNLSSVLVRLCQPLSEPCSAKLLKLQPTYCQATAGTRDQRLARNVHMQDLAKETCLVPAPSGTEPQLEASYSFLTEVFFLAHDCLHIGFEVASDRFTRINQMLHRIQSIYQDIGRQGGEQSDVGLRIKDQMEKGMSVFLTLKAAMTEHTYIVLTSRFLVATATYCTQLATVPGNADVFVTPAYPLSPDSVSPMLCFLPEFLVDNITGFLLFLRRFKDSAYEVMGEHLDHLMTFVLIFMANSNRLRNPHLRAQMAELLEALMPPREVSSHAFASPSFYRDRLFSQHPLVAVVSEALLTVFVSIEMTGQGVSFEQKFNYRRPMYAVLKYIWERDIHRTAVQQLAEDALRNIDNQPLFLRFINLLINDATYLLDEALSHMAQIKEKQEERERGDWAQLAPQQRQEVEMNYRHISMIARFHNIMGNETILSLALLTEHIHDIFCHPILVERIAAMLNYFLLHLVGPKKKNLKVKDFGEFDFKPQELVSHISQIYINLADREEFCRAVSQDGRSYSQQLFGQAVAVLQKIHWPMEKIVRFEHCASVIQRLAEKEKAAEEQLVDVPDEFLDPILGSLMTDPVLLPSGNIVDRATIARHVLSDQSDPFTRQPLNMDMVKPVTELRDRIYAWRASRTGSQQ